MELIKVENDIAILDPQVSEDIANFETQMKALAEKEEELKTAILNEMESKGIIKVETDTLAITYIAPTDRETFDKKTFREEHPDLYDEYISMSPVKSCIKIKVK
jgi:hypothetical protein